MRPIHAFTALLPLLLVAAHAQQSHRAATPNAPAGHTWHMKQTSFSATVGDPRQNYQGGIQLSEATLLVPEGWTAEAGVPQGFPPTDCAFNQGRFAVHVMSPDRKVDLLSYPGSATFWSTNRNALEQRAAYTRQWQGSMSCTIEQPKSLQASVDENLPKIIPNARPTGAVEPVPGLTAELAASLAQVNLQLAPRGSHIEAESGQIRFAAPGQEGAPIDGRLILMVVHRFDPAPGGGLIELTDAPLILLERAPAGQLAANEHLLDAVADSIHISPEWTAYWTGFAARLAQMRQAAQNQVTQIYANMAQDNANAAAKQAQIRQGTADYRRSVMNNVAANRSAALDHSSQQFALHMGDQAIYHDPASGQNVQMSSQYGHVWASNTGNTDSYILTDSPSFNPNGQAGSAGWTEMQPTH